MLEEEESKKVFEELKGSHQGEGGRPKFTNSRKVTNTKAFGEGEQEEEEPHRTVIMKKPEEIQQQKAHIERQQIKGEEDEEYGAEHVRRVEDQYPENSE